MTYSEITITSLVWYAETELTEMTDNDVMDNDVNNEIKIIKLLII